MQLIRPRSITRRAPSRSAFVALAAGLTVFAAEGSPRGEVVSFDSRYTLYREGTPYGNMLVHNPSVLLGAKPTESFGLHAGWQADVVSGASVKIRNETRGVDAVTTASVKDFRQVASGGFSLERKYVTFEAGYAYGWEHDYKSHSVDFSAKTELLQRSMELSIAYARNWDSVCDRVQSDIDPTRRRGLEKSTACFTADPTVTTRPLVLDAFQAGWTQLWSPLFATQLIYSRQVLNGFQSNPYREVNLGVSSPAQEYVPEVRDRQALALKANLYLRPIKTALRVGVRAYRDTWDIRSFTGEVELERYVLVDALRLRLRGRYYTQGSATFYSDDYYLVPRGKYFTGDRELSTMRSWMAGARFAFGPSAGQQRWGGLLSKVELSLGGDYVSYDYSDFTIAGTPLHKTAIIASFGASLLF